jgi:peroxiredoxin
MIALPVVLLAFFATNDPVEVLHRTAAVYENLRSFELAASLSVKVPGQDLTLTTEQTAIYATGVMLPADAPVPVLQFSMVGASPVIRNRAGQVVKWNVGGVSFEPFIFSGLDAIDKRVISARALPDETLDIGGESMLCAVVEALYEQRTPFNRGSGQPIRLWIEKKTSLVRQATYVRKWHNSEFAQWTVRVQKMTLDQPPPQWAIEKFAPLQKGREEPKWVGQAARDFSMKSLDGRTIGLAALRGKVVLLDFWATWCGPCREEMPLLEKLRDELKSQDVEIWGVTDERPDVARRWLAERKRSLPTLIDADRTLFRHYGIESIPVLVVIRGDGKVSSYVVGLRSERDLRADIAKAMQ